MQIRSILPALLIFGTFTLRAEDPASFEVGSLKFQRPQAWEWVPVSSPMRKAQLKIQSADKSQSAEVVFFHFGAGQGGGIQANAQRWMSQFQAAEGAGKVETREVGGVKMAIVTTQGTYRSGMPGGPTTALENHALLGAIIESAGGDVFVKMTGPVALVQAQSESFLSFVTSALGGKP
jgi:hypothetical protein